MQTNTQIIYIIVTATVALTCVAIAAVLLVLLVIKQKRKHYEEGEKIARQFQEEKKQAIIEIQDATLTQIGKDLHDNIGQLLLVSRLQFNQISRSSENTLKLSSLEDTLDKAMLEVKALSKSLDNSRVANFGLLSELQNEIARWSKMDICTFHLNADDDFALPPDQEILLFRITQEFISNSVKYSGCTQIDLRFSARPSDMKVRMRDNGRGFNMKEAAAGSGLKNIRYRASLLNAKDFSFASQHSAGTQLSFKIPVQNL